MSSIDNSSHIVYMIANKLKSKFQVGATSCSNISNLKGKLNSQNVDCDNNSFPSLVYYELINSSNLAKKWVDCLKDYSAEKKVSLVNNFNPDWNNLTERLD